MSPTHVRQKQIYVVVRRAPRSIMGQFIDLVTRNHTSSVTLEMFEFIKDRPAINVSY